MSDCHARNTLLRVGVAAMIEQHLSVLCAALNCLIVIVVALYLSGKWLYVFTCNKAGGLPASLSFVKLYIV